MARPKVGFPLFTLPHALTLGPAHWDPAHAAGTRQARSLKEKETTSWGTTCLTLLVLHISSSAVANNSAKLC